MVSTFGELVYESSRAFADDEEEEFQNQTGLSFEIEHTSAGQKLLEEKAKVEIDFCAFVGKVAVGFGDGLIKNQKTSELLAEVFMVGQGENVVDMYLNRPKKKTIAKLYQCTDMSNPAVFAVFNTYGVPRYLTNEAVEMLEGYMKICSRILVFHSDIMAYYKSEENCDRKVFFVASGKYPKEGLPGSCCPLTPPNVIGGVAAALVIYGEQYDKPALLLATYGENEIVDSISTRPFSNIVKQSKWSFSKLFAQLEKGMTQSVKPNVNPVEISNLYI